MNRETHDITGRVWGSFVSIEDERVNVECTINLQISVIWHYWSYKSMKKDNILDLTTLILHYVRARDGSIYEA